jgi:outer membrane protein TolC
MMTRILTILKSNLLCLFFASFLFAAEQSDPPTSDVMTLKALFFEALKNSERIAISEEAVKEAEALYRQALGDAFPRFSYNRQSFIEEKNDSHEGAFRISKTDLTGYRELAAIRAGRYTIEQRKYENLRVEQLLFQDVATAFYAYLLAEENVTATRKLISLGDDRLRDLKERVRIGRAREADALGQEVLIAALQSQLEESLRQVNARRDLLAFLIGFRELKHNIIDIPIAAQPSTLESHLTKALMRPDIQAAQENVNVDKSLLQVARSEYFPSLNLSVNAYTDRSGIDEEDRSDWDVLLGLDIPLWDWGLRRGIVDAANSALKQTQENLKLNLRQAELEIRNAYRDYESAKKQLDIQAKSVELARQDYDMQVRDDRQGLVTSLEVFESLDRLNSAELAFNNARLQEKLAAINLEITSGSRPEEILK